MESEIQAMQAVHAALADLDDAARARVLAWASSKFEIAAAPQDESPRSAASGASDSEPEFADIGDLIDATQPTDGPSRALVVAYWFQVIEGREGWGGGDINNSLKNLGHPLSNVTKTLTSLRERNPSLVMQVAKSGRSAQSRKTYKLTAAGMRHVKQMLTRGLHEAA